jgi:hypothetical protein
MQLTPKSHFQGNAAHYAESLVGKTLKVDSSNPDDVGEFQRLCGRLWEFDVHDTFQVTFDNQRKTLHGNPDRVITIQDSKGKRATVGPDPFTVIPSTAMDRVRDGLEKLFTASVR